MQSLIISQHDGTITTFPQLLKAELCHGANEVMGKYVTLWVVGKTETFCNYSNLIKRQTRGMEAKESPMGERGGEQG